MGRIERNKQLLKREIREDREENERGDGRKRERERELGRAREDERVASFPRRMRST